MDGVNKRMSELNLKEIQEQDGLQSSSFMPAFATTNLGYSPKSANKAVRQQSSKGRVRAFSSMPKNAVNFYTLKKGLYKKGNATAGKVASKSLSRNMSMVTSGESKHVAAKSVGMLTAYGELNNVGNTSAAMAVR